MTGVMNRAILDRAAANVAKDNVVPGEDVLVVASADQPAALIEALVSACDLAGASTATLAVLLPAADMRDYRHPGPVLAAVARADLTIVATSFLFPRAYDDLTKVVIDAGRRLVLINNAPPEEFARGATLADPFALRASTRNFAQRISEARTVRIVSPQGTDLMVEVCRPCLPLTGHAEDDTGFGSFPSGEAMLSPREGSASGRFIANSFVQVVYIKGNGPQIGLVDSPVELTFSKGRLVGLEGGRAARLLSDILDGSDETARMLAELGLGTNPSARAIAHVENKFRIGTAHIALGDNHLIGWRGRSTYGGALISGLHIDLVTEDVRIELDGVEAAP